MKVQDDSNYVVLAFIASDEEYADERPATTRSNRAVTRRAEIGFSFFWVNICLKQLSFNKLCQWTVTKRNLNAIVFLVAFVFLFLLKRGRVPPKKLLWWGGAMEKKPGKWGVIQFSNYTLPNSTSPLPHKKMNGPQIFFMNLRIEERNWSLV